MVSLSRRAAGEGIGAALLLATIVGSGIMGQRLSGGNVALALLANSIATGAVLTAVILAFGGVSGAHFNPVVTLAEASQGSLAWRDVPVYLIAQFAGAIAGVAVANVMFGLPIFSISHRGRSGPSQFFSEFIATFGLLIVIRGCARGHKEATAYAVGAYITGAYWFTSSTSFANPAVTVARLLSDTFAGIQPHDVPLFIVAQLLGAAGAAIVFRWLDRDPVAEV